MRKGISQIVSSVLLLSIAISVVGVYSQWAPQFSENISQDVSDQADNKIRCSNAAFDISEVQYDRTGQLVTLKVSNKGTINFQDDITVTAVNSSQIAGQKTVASLEVQETQQTEIKTSKVPEVIVASSKDCPELRVSEQNIEVQK